jgi:endonuclease III
MKGSREYSKKLRKLHRSLKSKYAKPQPVVYEEPLEALVYGVVSEEMSEAATQSAMKRFADYFIDMNDLRVSRVEEIVEVLGGEAAVARDTAATLASVLRAVYDKYSTVSLKTLKKMGKKPARQVIEKLEGVSPFTADYCTLASLHGHAIPLTERMLDYLKSQELVHPEADERQIAGFLSRQVSASNAYEFYALLRRESESRRAASKRKTTRKTKPSAAAKTKKKKKTKKATTRKLKK